MIVDKEAAEPANTFLCPVGGFCNVVGNVVLIDVVLYDRKWGAGETVEPDRVPRNAIGIFGHFSDHRACPWISGLGKHWIDAKRPKLAQVCGDENRIDEQSGADDTD